MVTIFPWVVLTCYLVVLLSGNQYSNYNAKNSMYITTSKLSLHVFVILIICYCSNVPSLCNENRLLPLSRCYLPLQLNVLKNVLNFFSQVKINGNYFYNIDSKTIISFLSLKGFVWVVGICKDRRLYEKRF